jgi:uncharacterized spore protein YtfJ
MTSTDAIRATVDELLRVLSARNIIGEPMDLEDKIIIPITKMGMGFGTGQGMEPGGKETIKVEAGGGAGVIPVAIVVVFKGIPGEDGVKVIPLSSHSSGNQPLAEVASVAQSILERFAASQERKGKERQEKKSSRETAVHVE